MVCLYNQEQGQENEMWYGVGPLLHHIVQKPSWWQFCYLNVWLEVINIHLEQGEEDGGVCMSAWDVYMGRAANSLFPFSVHTLFLVLNT